jgi:cytochrome c heme-lyase
MFYNALARKGKLQDTNEDDIESVVALHNNMNEKTWKKVVEWEQVITNTNSTNEMTGSKLLKFQGRPSDLSPKAAFKYYVLGHPLPYDRHDWTIVRTDGTEQRYVIDYYYDDSRARTTADTAKPDLHDSTGTPSLLVDVRPALDNVTSVLHRSIIMPYARHIKHTTNFEPLPMLPTSTMKSHVKESIDVWQSIQQYVANRKDQSQQVKLQSEDEDSMKVVIDENTMKASINEKEAKELNKLFLKVTKDCSTFQKKVDQCTNDNECTKASIDLTICMGTVLCPLQSKTLTNVLKEESIDNTNIDTALSRLNDCVTCKTTEYQYAKKQYPTIVK